jgi:hypothetical protein
MFASEEQLKSLGYQKIKTNFKHVALQCSFVTDEQAY